MIWKYSKEKRSQPTMSETVKSLITDLRSRTFENLSKEIDIIINKIKIVEYVQQMGDSLKYKVFDINENSDFEKLGFEVTRKDYWSKLKAFCIHYRLTERKLFKKYLSY